MINEDIPGIKAVVTIDSVDLPEYDPHSPDDVGDEETNGVQVTKYIECQNDKNFAIRLRIDKTYPWGYRDHSISLQIYVDGNWVGAYMVREADVDRPTLRQSPASNPYLERIVKGRDAKNETTGQWTQRKLQFSAVETVDDATAARVEKDTKTAKYLGTIEVRVIRGLEFGETAGSHYNYHDPNLVLSEKSLKGKAVSHGAILGPAKPVATPRFIDFRRLSDDTGPIAIFRFLYRSREALKREMVLPRSPSPRPDDLSRLPEAERDRLAAERLEQLNRLKAEGDGRGPAIKREHGVMYDLTGDAPIKRMHPSKRTKIGDKMVDVVDLCDDSD